MGLQGQGNLPSCKLLQANCEIVGDLEVASSSNGGHATRGNAKTLFATIAYQLALAVPWLHTSISRIVEDDPSVIVRSIAIQIKTLVFDPCRSHVHQNCDPIIILIDGLDECEGHEVQEEILRAIHHSCRDLIPLRFMVASRPEAHIREVFESPVYTGSYRAFNVEQSFDDVRKYLRDEFSRIHHEHRTMANIPLPWPSQNVLEQLVYNSSGYFIYASTIIKFIDDKNYRPTERLVVLQDPNRSSSDSAFGTLDHLYITILSSLPRQSELIPILCAIVHFRVSAVRIDQLFGLAEGETQLILRGLHSLLNIPSENTQISSHHASFIDFLSNSDRSGNFCVTTLNSQISLARSLLRPCASRRCNNMSQLNVVIKFIISLPPSGAMAELFPLIGSVHPDYIFARIKYSLAYEHLRDLISWLKNTLSPPTDVIQLWEDYAFMFSINTLSWCPPPVEHIVLPSPELLRILLACDFLHRRLRELPSLLDLTWTDLRMTLCGLRPKSPGDKHALPVHHPQAAYPLVARDLAVQLIRKLVKNNSDTNGGVNPSATREAVLYDDNYPWLYGLRTAYSRSQNAIGCNIACLVRLSPPCPALYHELWSIPLSEIWSSVPSGNTLIYHVSKWLESFPDSTMDLITFWQQGVPRPELCHTGLYYRGPEDEEDGWGDLVKSYNAAIVRLHLPRQP
ncbi:NACHT domain-containing protein [Mycena sanguinolenta]|uniref:NACHT domain-containing protein n=1 Tax=Mycena sanguinolenta TaxID=230812 RepID=A0A8H6ZC12_9AGAR|nr:NACHT domain-containing protein [Mycena sanguinolenta]